LPGHSYFRNANGFLLNLEAGLFDLALVEFEFASFLIALRACDAAAIGLTSLTGVALSQSTAAVAAFFILTLVVFSLNLKTLLDASGKASSRSQP
jgi:hypothetical protein